MAACNHHPNPFPVTGHKQPSLPSLTVATGIEMLRILSSSEAWFGKPREQVSGRVIRCTAGSNSIGLPQHEGNSLPLTFLDANWGWMLRSWLLENLTCWENGFSRWTEQGRRKIGYIQLPFYSYSSTLALASSEAVAVPIDAILTVLFCGYPGSDQSYRYWCR